LDVLASHAIMAAAWEESSMRKIIGLCFLTVTLFASSARAQSIFIEKGDPSAVDAVVGGSLLKNAWGAGVGAGYSYRGVFDVGADFTRYAYTSGTNNKLAGYSVAPFTTWHALRSDVDELPVSISATLAVQRIVYAGNGPVANPEGWGLVVGPSVYRRMEFGTKLVFVPELLVAYDFSYTRYYSEAGDQTSSNTANSGTGAGYATEAKHNVRVLLRPNLLYRMGNTNLVIVPYVGSQGLSFMAGGNIGAIF
jgi:hypothetical protein